MDLERPPPRSRGIYLLPNLFTTCGLFAGFYAIIAAANSQFTAAAIAVFVAGIMDGIDGRVARLTGTSSAFGVQYDAGWPTWSASARRRRWSCTTGRCRR